MNRLDKVESLLAVGDEDAARNELLALRKRLDGCNGSTREKADKNDWITSCKDQREVRDLLDQLVDSL